MSVESEERDELEAIAEQARAHLSRLRGQGLMWVPVGEAEPAKPAPVFVSSLSVVREELGECTRCKLHKTRKNIVFGVGNPEADLVFVGEAPGANEDIQGEPFVGDAGQL